AWLVALHGLQRLSPAQRPRAAARAEHGRRASATNAGLVIACPPMAPGLPVIARPSSARSAPDSLAAKGRSLAARSNPTGTRTCQQGSWRVRDESRPQMKWAANRGGPKETPVGATVTGGPKREAGLCQLAQNAYTKLTTGRTLATGRRGPAEQTENRSRR